MPTPLSVHFDYELNHPAIVTSAEDSTIVGESVHGPLPRIVHYYAAVDLIVIIDFNLPEAENLIAFQRRGETAVRWRRLVAYSAGVILYDGVNTMTGKPHICLVSDDRLLAWFTARGYPVYRTSLAQFVTNGAIPVIPAAVFDQAVRELNQLGVLLP